MNLKVVLFRMIGKGVKVVFGFLLHDKVTQKKNSLTDVHVRNVHMLRGGVKMAKNSA